MSNDTVQFEADITVDQAYALLDQAPPQTFVDIGPGLRVKRTERNVPIIRLHYSAIPERNPVLNPIWSAKPEDRDSYKDVTPAEWNRYNERRKYSSAGWDREQEIIDEAGGGEKLFAGTLATFAKFIIIDDPSWYPKPWWKVVGGFDHGLTNATTLIKAYIDELGNIYLCGEYYQMRTEQWANTIHMNVPMLNRMPDLQRMAWLRADPSIFYDIVPDADGAVTNAAAIYKKNGFTRLTPFPSDIPREDLTYEARLNDHWKNIGDPAKGGRLPSLYIVCRNAKDQRQPGLHPYDCPNLLWELKRIRRQELTAKQLMTRNPTEKIVDKDNHAFDASKYIVMSLPKPSEVPLQQVFAEQVQGLNPMSQAIHAQRFMGMHGGMAITQQNAGGVPVRQPQKPLDFRSRARMPR